MTDAATALGASKARISIQQDFVKSLMDAVSRGVGQLVDADMNEELTKLQALQVKQQLGVQSLSHRQHVEPVDPVALPAIRLPD